MSDLPPNTRKFWLSSVAFFAGMLAVGLIASCAKGEDPVAHLGFAQPMGHEYSPECVDGDVVLRGASVEFKS